MAHCTGAAPIRNAGKLWTGRSGALEAAPIKTKEVEQLDPGAVQAALQTEETHMHTQTPRQSTPPLQEHWLTSAECRNACHRRSKTLTISEFTSAQAQGSARSDGPPNSLVIKDKDTEEGEGERNEGLRKEKEGGEGEEEAGGEDTESKEEEEEEDDKTKMIKKQKKAKKKS